MLWSTFRQRSETQKKASVLYRPTMYHVVNGGYEHEGRWRIIDSSGYQFTGIKWRVVRIPWQDPGTLRAIAMMSSQVQKREHVIELSFLDELVHLRRIIEDYLVETGTTMKSGQQLPRGFCKAISRMFSGGKEYSNNTLRHLISISAKISMKTTLMMRDLIDEECPSIAKSLHRNSDSDSPGHVVDTRVFRKLINSKSLRGAKKFLDSATTDEDRRSGLQRLKYIARDKSNYKGVDHSSLDAQLELASNGRKAIAAFRNRILPNNEWPDAVKPLLRNILWTTKLDEAIIESLDKPNELLQALKLAYLNCAGAEGGQKVEQYEKFVADQTRNADATRGCQSTQLMDEDENASLPVSGTGATDGTADTEQVGNNAITTVHNEESLDPQSRTDAGLEISTDDNSDQMNEDQTTSAPAEEQQQEQDFLEECEVDLYALTWEIYNRTVLTEQEIFDLVISDPFQKAAAGSATVIDSDRRANFVQFVKKVLVPGGYVFLIVPQLELSAWLTAMEEFDFKNESVFTLLKDPESVQRLRGRSFQNLVEVAVVARKGGRHPSGFVMDVLSPYTQLPRNRYKRRAPVIDSIAPPTSKLRYPGSKALVRTGEKSPALFWELMKTFCAPGGRVLDPFAGTLTTGIAAVKSGRRCILLESDEKCFSLGRERLEEIARVKIEEDQADNALPEISEEECEFLDEHSRRNQDSINLDQENLQCEESEVSKPNSDAERDDADCDIVSNALESPNRDTSTNVCISANKDLTDPSELDKESETTSKNQTGTRIFDISSNIVKNRSDTVSLRVTEQKSLDDFASTSIQQVPSIQSEIESAEKNEALQNSASAQKISSETLKPTRRKRNAEEANIPASSSTAASRPRRTRRNNQRYR